MQQKVKDVGMYNYGSVFSQTLLFYPYFEADIIKTVFQVIVGIILMNLISKPFRQFYLFTFFGLSDSGRGRWL